MDDLDNRNGTDLLFRTADADWCDEVARRFGRDKVAAYRYRPEGQGDPGTILHQAYEARDWAYRRWIAARGVPDVRLRPHLKATQPDTVLTLLGVATSRSPRSVHGRHPEPASPSADGPLVSVAEPLSERAIARGERFRSARKRCAYDIRGLAGVAGVDPDRIRALEGGHGSVDPRDVERIARTLGVTIEGEPVAVQRPSLATRRT
ncbi:helix-turn-helix transcriptional regulator [Methylobacterium durans]|uniref:helix-turn-helix domain-containing protein n=1 Tax=Methylobacterium durans TaxID=2202825 RepID=UPI002AFDD208|nr:helix-turn-helix transcriptional regulator [Methylobacterium durans]MEA1833703.1 helix-turn-helix transcriptional regulator [Methylobacterium durans]